MEPVEWTRKEKAEECAARLEPENPVEGDAPGRVVRAGIGGVGQARITEPRSQTFESGVVGNWVDGWEVRVVNQETLEFLRDQRGLHELRASRGRLSLALLGQSLLVAEKERAGTDPELREGFQVLLVGARDRVFLAAFYAEKIFSRRTRFDFFHKRAVHDHRAMDADESEWLERLRYHGHGLAQEIGTRLLLKQHIVTLSQNSYHLSRIDKADSSVDLDGDPNRGINPTLWDGEARLEMFVGRHAQPQFSIRVIRPTQNFAPPTQI